MILYWLRSKGIEQLLICKLKGTSSSQTGKSDGGIFCTRCLQSNLNSTSHPSPILLNQQTIILFCFYFEHDWSFDYIYQYPSQVLSLKTCYLYICHIIYSYPMIVLSSLYFPSHLYSYIMLSRSYIDALNLQLLY